MDFYKRFTANFPKNSTDVFFDTNDKKNFSGIINNAVDFVLENQLYNEKMWATFAEQFTCNADDHDAGWRGEFWGKTMRGASFVYSYTKDEKLYNILKKSVKDMMNAQDEFGRISTFSVEREFDGWDLWGRKYVLLGMQYFVEVAPDEEFNREVIECMRKQGEYLVSKIGRVEDGKKLITKLTRHWRGLNSSSILEPIVRLYSITEDKKFLDFATYIIDCGFTEIVNFIDLVLEGELKLHEFPITKAYEMTSCFVGLLEYYRITKNEKHLQAVIKFADLILENEFTVIGSSGCTHELFDHSTARQANDVPFGTGYQETCVTVTLMQFFCQLNHITGDSKYMDAFEISLYNAYLGAFNTENAIDTTAKEKFPQVEIVPMPFDSYSPLTAGKRGNGIGGFRAFKDGRFYGCCICIGSAGIGVAMKNAVVNTKNGVAINLFESGVVTKRLLNGSEVTLEINTEYPVDDSVNVRVLTGGEFEVLLRNPYWSENTEVCVNGESVLANKGYIKINRTWKSGDVIKVKFDMTAKAIFPTPYGRELLTNRVIWGINYMYQTVDREPENAKHHVAIRRGPLMLAQENRLGYNVDDAVEVKVENGGEVKINVVSSDYSPYKCILAAEVPTKDGNCFLTTDYSSAGKLWNEQSKMAVWFKTK